MKSGKGSNFLLALIEIVPIFDTISVSIVVLVSILVSIVVTVLVFF